MEALFYVYYQEEWSQILLLLTSLDDINARNAEQKHPFKKFPFCGGGM